MTNSLELFPIFCLWSNKLVQSCYLITVLLHLSVIPQWYYKNGYKYFYSVLNTLHKPSSRLVLPKYLRFHIKKADSNFKIIPIQNFYPKPYLLCRNKNTSTSFYPHKVLFTSTSAWSLLKFLFCIGMFALQFCIATQCWEGSIKGGRVRSIPSHIHLLLPSTPPHPLFRGNLNNNPVYPLGRLQQQ